MIEVKTRSEASWGILSNMDTTSFHAMINERRWPVSYQMDRYIKENEIDTRKYLDMDYE